MNGMTAKEVNTFFNKKNDYLLSYALKKCQQFKRTYSPEDVLSEIYIKIHRKEFNNIEHLERSVLTYISTEIKSCNSSLNYIRKINRTHELTDMIIEETDLNPVIEYYENTKNIEHKILLEAYIELGYNTQVKLSKYFKLSTTTINNLFKEIKINIVTLNKNQIK